MTTHYRRNTTILPLGAYRRHGYFFREAAMLTIAMGGGLHLYRVIFGDELTLRYVVTPTTDRILLVPMTYAAITGILLLSSTASSSRTSFIGRSSPDRSCTLPATCRCTATARTSSRTLHVDLVPDVVPLLLLILVYPAFLTMFWRLEYRN